MLSKVDLRCSGDDRGPSDMGLNLGELLSPRENMKYTIFFFSIEC